MEQCFEIIREGSGRDFDPVLAEVFLDIKEKVVRIHNDAAQELLQKEHRKEII